jgi:hypothetical protein
MPVANQAGYLSRRLREFSGMPRVFLRLGLYLVGTQPDVRGATHNYMQALLRAASEALTDDGGLEIQATCYKRCLTRRCAQDPS